MEPTKTDLFLAALQNSWRRMSVWFSLAWAAFVSYYMNLPQTCSTPDCTSQQGLLSLLHIPAPILPFVLGFLPVLILASIPQPTYSAKVAESADTKARNK